MPIRFDGMEFDTVQELIEYKKNFQESQEEVKEKVIYVKQETTPEKTHLFKNTAKKWTEEEDQKVKELYQKYIGKDLLIRTHELSEELGRSMPSIRTRASTEGYTKLKEGIDTGIKGAMIRNKPLRIPKEEQQKQPKEKFEFIEEFPKFKTVQEHLMPILEKLIRYKISSGGEMSYANDGFAIGIEDGNKWRYFCEEFMEKQGKVKKYFGIKGRFTLYKARGKYHTIKYL